MFREGWASRARAENQAKIDRTSFQEDSASELRFWDSKITEKSLPKLLIEFSWGGLGTIWGFHLVTLVAYLALSGPSLTLSRHSLNVSLATWAPKGPPPRGISIKFGSPRSLLHRCANKFFVYTESYSSRLHFCKLSKTKPQSFRAS